MKKTAGIAVMNFFGISALIGLLDLVAARFDIAAFVRIAARPAHLAFIAVFGLILAAAAFVRPQHAAAAA